MFGPTATQEVRQTENFRNPEIPQSAGFAGFLFTHNVQVAFLAFALGMTAGIGTMWLMVQNGLMLGTLAGLFTAAGKSSVFWLAILPHGMLELTAIFIAAGAGLRMGWPMIAPGDRPRGVAVREAASDAVIVALGVVPAFAIAATIESFI